MTSRIAWCLSVAIAAEPDSFDHDCPRKSIGLRSPAVTRLSRQARHGRIEMRIARCLALTLAVLGTTAPTLAQAPDTRPITLVVPIAAGGGMDTIGRTIAERLQ